MRIESSQLLLASTHEFVRQTERDETLRAWRGDRRPDFEGRGPGRPPRVDTSEISDGARAAAETQETEASAEDGSGLSPKLQFLIALVERLTGQKVRIIDPSNFHGRGEAAAAGAAAKEVASTPARQGWGVEYDLHERVTEAETTAFSASGVVKTADGREISFQLDLAMARASVETTDVSIRLGDAKLKDPLVLNFNGNAAELTDTKISFDIDTDGTADTISFLKPGSAFLFIDRNGDGKATDGSELFGATSGNGFADLSALDGDGNGWIDEADAAFQSLQLWSQDGAGVDVVQDLAEAGVGAISLASVGTPFQVKDAAQQLQGVIRQTGVYLTEAGGVGTVQQIDLAA